jgi:hypothetical protein
MEYPHLKHNAWDAAYRGTSLFDWFLKFHRDRFPDKVSFVTSSYRYRDAGWVHVDALMPGLPASIEARFTAPNKIEIQTRHLDAFSIRPVGHPKYSAGRPLAVTIDGVAVKPDGSLSFSKTSEGWKAGRTLPGQDEKKSGLEGPISDAITSRHVYVYGTGGTPRQVDEWHDQAKRAADWSNPLFRIPVNPSVYADDELTDYDLQTANVVLLGSRETNKVIARFADQLPLTLQPSAADYGLLYIFPVGGHYFLVNSGLPWWTGAEKDTPPNRLLSGLGDYVLFRGSLRNVIAAGRFDKRWRIARPLPIDAPVVVTTPDRP